MRWGFPLGLAVVLCIAAAGVADAAGTKKQNEQARPKQAWELPMKVVVVRSSGPDCEPLCPEWISAEGEITTASPAQLRKALKIAGKKKLPVIINSPGGHMTAAMEIGRMIRKAKLDVAVGWTKFADCAPNDKGCKLPKAQKGVYRGIATSAGGFCNSACPLVLASGVRRMSGMWSYVGVHQVRTILVQERITYRETYRIVKGKKKVISRQEVSRKPHKTTQKDGIDKRLQKTLLAYFNEMDISPAMLDDMNKAPFTSIYRLNLQRQDELKLITARTSAELLTYRRACIADPPADNCIAGAVQAAKKPLKSALIPIPRQKPDIAHRGRADSMTARSMTVTTVRSEVPGCEPLCAQWIAAEGDITEQTPALFKRIFDAIDDLKLPVVISSAGGDLDAALEIGRMIRARGLDVIVAHSGYSYCDPRRGECQVSMPRTPLPGRIVNPGECSGTCVMLLAAGQRRILPKSTTVVVRHPTQFRSRLSRLPPATQIANYLAEMGSGKGLMNIMSSMGPGADRMLLDSDLRQATLLTEQVRVAGMDHPDVCRSPKPALACVKW